MLAYVFWHAPRPEEAGASYEANLAAFHRALGAHRPPGFRGSMVLRAPAAPWLPGARPIYEDWYLLDGSAALDPLNEAAVSAAVKEIHDRPARQSGSAAAGLYRLRRGAESPGGARFALWLAKPPGMGYDDLDARLAPWAGSPGAGLWRRQMTLGPTREFCLRLAGRADLPAPFEPLSIEMEPVWPDDR